MIGTFDGLGAVGADVLEAIRTQLTETPLFVFPGRSGYVPTGRALAALRRLTGDETLSFLDVESETKCSFGTDDLLGAFAGQTLHEGEPRVLASLASSGAAFPLATNPRGLTFARFESGVFVAVVPQLEVGGGRLKDEFRSERFLGLLPLLVFLRAALGAHAWASPPPRAVFMIDDPNFRFGRYGFVEYRHLIEASKTHGFHTSIAMIPIDWRKTSRRVARLLRDNNEHVSLVMHGVDHVSEEFAGAASLRRAESTVAQGLARMNAHEKETGLPFAQAITFPHGICSTNWMRAVRNSGLEAAVIEWARPIDLDPEDDPLYEMHPGELSFLAFPMINRFAAEDPKEELLFKAFLGKPLIVYTHHGYFRDGGLEALAHLADYLNRRLAPRWSAIGEIVRSNYQVRTAGSGLALRVFANHVDAEIVGQEFNVVVKPSIEIPSDEVCCVNGSRAAPVVVPGVGTAFPVRASSRLDVIFGPLHPTAVPVAPSRPSPKSIVRRLATELRDQVVQPLLRLALAAMT